MNLCGELSRVTIRDSLEVSGAKAIWRQIWPRKEVLLVMYTIILYAHVYLTGKSLQKVRRRCNYTQLDVNCMIKVRYR